MCCAWVAAHGAGLLRRRPGGPPELIWRERGGAAAGWAGDGLANAATYRVRRGGAASGSDPAERAARGRPGSKSVGACGRRVARGPRPVDQACGSRRSLVGGVDQDGVAGVQVPAGEAGRAGQAASGRAGQPAVVGGKQGGGGRSGAAGGAAVGAGVAGGGGLLHDGGAPPCPWGGLREKAVAAVAAACRRSEEHTSELQSRRDLVCRLLLEKKKKKQNRSFLPIKKKNKK